MEKGLGLRVVKIMRSFKKQAIYSENPYYGDP